MSLLKFSLFVLTFIGFVACRERSILDSQLKDDSSKKGAATYNYDTLMEILTTNNQDWLKNLYEAEGVIEEKPAVKDIIFSNSRGPFDLKRLRIFVIIAKNLPLESTDPNKADLLMVAIQQRTSALAKNDASGARTYLKIISHLVVSGASPDRSRILEQALKTEDVELLKTMIDDGIDLNCAPSQKDPEVLSGKNLNIEDPKVRQTNIILELEKYQMNLLKETWPLGTVSELAEKYGQKSFALSAWDVNFVPMCHRVSPAVQLNIIGERSYEVKFKTKDDCLKKFIKWRDLDRRIAGRVKITFSIENESVSISE